MSQQTPNTSKKFRQPRTWLFGLMFIGFGSWAANEVIEYVENADIKVAEAVIDNTVIPVPSTETAEPKVTTADEPSVEVVIETESVNAAVDGELEAAEDIIIESNADEEDLEYLSVEEIMAEDEDSPAPVAKTEEEEDENADFVNLDEILYGTTDEEEINKIKAEEGDLEPPTRQSLESEMQSLKQEVLAVNRDLFILEEDLLFPSGTQVNVFVSIDASEYFSLDGVSLKINDRPISNHLYTRRELAALERGAVQRLFTGNLPTGEHELVAIVTGQGPEKRDFRRAVSIDFTKKSGTKYVELKIQGDDLRKQPLFQLKEWD